MYFNLFLFNYHKMLKIHIWIIKLDQKDGVNYQNVLLTDIEIQFNSLR